MNIKILNSNEETGRQAAQTVYEAIQDAITIRNQANIILATGASQFALLNHLVKQPVQWSQVNVFHLDEYIDLPETHPASFRKYLRERFVSRITGKVNFVPVDGNAPDPFEECHRLSKIISEYPIDLACVGIGENGHLAFNDPPADFDTNEPYIVVDLDEACRKQQLGEGWFESLDAVPRRAISMSIKQIMKSEQIICTVPDLRKAVAVQKTVEGPITNLTPASILQSHQRCILILDADSSSLLNKETLGGFFV